MALLVVMLLVGGFGARAWYEAKEDPIVRRASLAVPGMPAGSGPVTIALLSDIHVAEPDMPPARLSRIVGQVNALKPDVIVIAVDLVSEHGKFVQPYPVDLSIAPLAGLRAPLGVVAVLGNHDGARGRLAVRRQLARRGIKVIADAALRAGPLALGGLADGFHPVRHLERTLAAMKGVGGARVVISHRPDAFGSLPGNTGLMLAGHTHCGQIRLLGWAPVTNSRFGQRYACGLVRERGNVLIVTAGLGTSLLPFRLDAPPDIWLITVRPR
jgi:predicted MPP superfamily phosphohydrolase